ncbi:hypothetical protein GCM10011585_09870 [Edaphobacter dinghuensis]|uniref:Uncharacterized protein n=1 Tax=Edaphobacter dinghuensis TaxID=1560005 RepID=A0A917H7A1_9BACT|nr:hypothetical protein GCM10011585_09870 [Edaphobacter dinghuensis]
MNIIGPADRSEAVRQVALLVASEDEDRNQRGFLEGALLTIVAAVVENMAAKDLVSRLLLSKL